MGKEIFCKGKIRVKIFTEDNGVSDGELEVNHRHATSPRDLAAWGLSRTQQVIDRATGAYCQFISTVSYQPLRLFPGLSDENESKNIDEIAAEAVDDELAYVDERKRKGRLTLYVGIIAVIFAIIVSIGAYIVISRGGPGGSGFHIKLG